MAIILRSDFGGRRTLGRPTHEAFVQRAAAELGNDLLPPWGRRVVGYDLVIAHELVVPYGRPDVVVASVDLDAWRRRRRGNVLPCTAPAPLRTAIELRQLGGAAEIDNLAKLIGRTRVQTSLRVLARLNWVRVTRGAVTLVSSANDAVAAMAGVEVKLNNWRRAVGQVQSWEALFDSSWIAFPESYISHVPRTPALRRLGLVSVDGEVAKIVRRARVRRARGLRVALADEYLFARWMAELDLRRAKTPSRVGVQGK